MTARQSLSIELAERIDALCDRFEDDWTAGRDPQIEQFLPQSPDHESKIFAALLRLELELRQRSGETLDPNSYHVRFPQFAEAITRAFAEQMALVDTSVSRTPATVALAERSGADDEILPATIGRFEVLGQIGSGAFGVVLKARDPHLEREVAIKLPRQGCLNKPGDQERFLREAKAAANMHHPNICPVYEVGTADGRPYIVMSLVPGKSLAEHVKQNKEPMAIRQAALIVRKLAQALELAHGKGIVHRDLKPANVMLDRERKDVVIMDFGLARFERENDIGLTQSGMVMGTPAYMSPEQARGDQKVIGPATDIYSLGVILHELLTRQRPFEGSLAEVLGKILHVEAPGPAAFRPEVDPQLDAIVRKCMAKSPGERFHSMRELADTLTTYAKGGASSAADQSSLGAVPPANARTPTSTDDLLAAFSSDLKQQAEQNLSETRAAIEMAVRSAKIPLWQWLTGAALFAALLLCGIIFFARPPTATVLINIDVDLKDAELRFVLDNIGIPAANLAEPMELKVGRHELMVYRGDKLERRFVFEVKGEPQPGIAIEEDTGPPNPPAPAGIAAKPGEWTPLLEGDNPLEKWDVNSDHANRRVLPSPRRLQFKGFANLSPRIVAQEYVVRARIKPTQDGKVSLAGNGVERKGSNHIHIDPDGRVYLARSTVKGTDFKLLGDARTSFDGEGFADVALAFYKGKIQVYSGSRLLIESHDDEYRGGRTYVLFFNPKGWDQGDGEIRDLQMFILEGTKFTPEEALKLLAKPSTRDVVDKQEDEGFVPIFNGKDLTGWKTHPSQPGGWMVEDGLLTGISDKAHHLFSEQGDYNDFHLRAEVRINKFGNSGIYFRGPFKLDRQPNFGGHPDAYEVQILNEFPKPNTGLTGSLRDAGRNLQAFTKQLVKPDEWFTMEIVAQGKRLIVKVNGTETANVEDGAFSKGHIILQARSDNATGVKTKVQFRKIEVKRLAGSPL